MRWLAPAAQRSGYVCWSAVLLLAGAAIFPWVMPASSPAMLAKTAEKSRAAPQVEALPPIAHFAAVFQRPLFSPSRRPDLPGHQPGATSSLAGRYRLLGIVRVGAVRRALIADGDRKVELFEGSMLDGWKALQIEHDRVIFSSSAGQTVLQLRRPGDLPVQPHPPVLPADASKQALSGDARETPPVR